MKKQDPICHTPQPMTRRPALIVWLAAAAGLQASAVPAKEFELRNARMWEYVEYSLPNSSWEGNPFDVVAVVSFTHPTEVRRTEMFYAGGGTWKFRFTGTQPGRWHFSTASGDPQLDGHTGAIVVEPRMGREIKGFLTSSGNKYAIMEENSEDLAGYVYQVFMNQQDFEQQYRHPSRLLGAPDRSGLIHSYWENTRENGFNIYFLAVFYSWFRMGALSIDDFAGPDDPALDTPDPAVFDMLERAILHAHQRGGRAHIWAWGDNDRKQTPNHLPDGFRGIRHQRLIRYIAARLGPLPGWSMNFGFDTIEMPNVVEDAAWWAGQLQAQMGWPHILTCRGWAHEAFGAHSYAGFGGAQYNLQTSNQGPADYHEVLEHMLARTDKPSIYEERHTYNRWQCWPHAVIEPDRLDESGCRRLIWWQAMAGGMGGFWGHFSDRFNVYGPFDQNGPCSYHPESLKVAFRTHHEFWKDGRLRVDMVPDNARAAGPGAYCLVSADNRHFIFFVEDAAEVTLDLSRMPEDAPLTAVDAKAPYREVHLGRVVAGVQTIELGHVTDWALAIGRFDRPDAREASHPYGQPPVHH